MKKLLLVLALLLAPSAAFAQCNGIFPNNTICGNISGAGAVPKPVPNSALTGVPGGTNGQVQYNNNGAFGGVTVSCAAGQAVRIINSTTTCVPVRIALTTDTTFYVATTGTDNAACGTAIGTPCLTRGYLYNTILYGSYDLAGHTVTIQLADGTYSDNFVTNGPLVGQGTSVLITGNTGNKNAVKIEPAQGNNYSTLSYNGANLRLQYQWGSQKNQVTYTNGLDIFAVSGTGSKIFFGAGITIGCTYQFGNGLTIAFGGYAQFDSDFDLSTTECNKTTTATYLNNATAVTVASATGLQNEMGIISADFPSDARITQLSGTSFVVSCLASTTTCKSSSAGTGAAITFVTGGQTFIDWGNAGQLYFNTNGDPDSSIIGTISGNPFYHFGWYNVNTLSSANAQAVTFPGFANVASACPTVQLLSVLDIGAEGILATPCMSGGNNGAGTPIHTLTIAAGATTGSLDSATDVHVNQTVSGWASQTSTWTAGQATLAVTSATGITTNSYVTAEGILAGAKVTGVSGLNITIGGCSGLAIKCVSGRPTYLAKTGGTVYYLGACVPTGTVVTGLSGTTVTLSKPATSDCTGTQQVIFGGTVTGNSIWN